MQGRLNIPQQLTGLTEEEVLASRKEYGSNVQQKAKRQNWWLLLMHILKEPMLILLIAISIIYFITGQNSEAFFMLAAIIIVSGISFYQDTRSRKALEALEALTEPLSLVLRNGEPKEIATKDIVVNDLVIVTEGQTINADGTIVHSNDFSVNESSLTGEAYPVFKSADSDDKRIYSGTLAASGLAVFKVDKTGTRTEIGKLGSSITSIKEAPTPLQLQIEKFVKSMALVGIIFFLVIWAVNYYESRSWLNSLLKGLTLAMSILPEEIPVAFTTFMALGSWRLMKKGVIVKKTRTVETLGGATVICTDKTGTLTENIMQLQAVYSFNTGKLYENKWSNNDAITEVITTAMWASEPVPFDPMEKTLHEVYEQITPSDKRKEYSMVHEYPLSGKPPIMTHVFENRFGNRIIATKGAPEAVLKQCSLSAEKLSELQKILDGLTTRGYRVLAIASSDFIGAEFPKQQQEFELDFAGLIAFYDPPKPNIKKVLSQFYEAGMDVKIMTGDNPVTARAIASQAGLRNASLAVDGEALMQLPQPGQIEKIHSTSLFTRMFPEAKLVAIEALKKDNQVVAMVGDGVNDGPALKAANIGIAMGKKGTEIAKTAADLVLIDDDLSRMVEAIAAGRRIYTNIKKAVQYIISIHIPIILTVALPLFLGWIYPAIFTPVHVIFLELVMGPTCSIAYENEPMEKNTMQQPPRSLSTNFLSWKEMSISILQGLIISAGVLFMYQYSVLQGGNEEHTRSMVFSTLIFSNIFLSLANRSFYYSFIESFSNNNKLLIGIIVATIALLLLMLYTPQVSAFFKLTPLSLHEINICVIAAAISVLWFEVWKLAKRKKKIVPAAKAKEHASLPTGLTQ